MLITPPTGACCAPIKSVKVKLGEVLARATTANRYAFDRQCRVTAIKGAVAAGSLETDARLSINFLPKAVYSPVPASS